MGVFAKRARLNSQPVYAAAVDWSNPLTRGLVSALPASAGDVDLVAGRPSDTAGTRVIATNPKGPARKYTSAGARWEIAPSSLESGVTVLSVAAAGSASSLEIGLTIFSSDDNLYVTYETGAFRLFRRNGGGFPGASFTQTLEAGRTYVTAGIQRSAALRELWVDGVLRATNTTNVTRSSVFYRSGTNYGETGAQSAGSFPATYEGPALSLVWNRALSEAEMAEVSANPWQLFAPRRIWVPAAGAGPVTHATTGALTNAGATLAGSAAVVRVHGTSGTLANAGAAIAASAARTRAHPTSGVLANAGAVVVGSAARAGGATTHDTTGALATSGALVVGLAARVAIHATTGALVAGGAFIAGSAARVGAPVTHATSGSLAGQGAIIVGVAAGPFVPSGDQILAVPRFGLRVKTGELFALVLDAGNVPIAYRRSNGGLVSIRLINTTTRSAAINDQGDIIQII